MGFLRVHAGAFALMQPAARRFARVSSSSSGWIPRSNRVVVEAPFVLHRHVQQRCKSVAASAPSGPFKEEQEHKRISKQERRAMVEAFVDRYRSLNAGRFPTTSHTKQHTGGSFYVVRQIIQELEYRHKASPPNKIKEIQLEKVEEVMYTSSGAIEEPASSEAHNAATRSYSSDKDLDVSPEQITIDTCSVDLDAPQNVVIGHLEAKKPVLSSDVHKSSVQESVGPERTAIELSIKQTAESVINPGVSGQTVSEFLVDREAPRNESSSRLATDDTEDNDQGSTSAQVDSSVIAKDPREAEQTDLTGDQERMLENEVSLPERSNVWGNLKAFANGIFSFWKKR